MLVFLCWAEFHASSWWLLMRCAGVRGEGEGIQGKGPDLTIDQ